MKRVVCYLGAVVPSDASLEVNLEHGKFGRVLPIAQFLGVGGGAGDGTT